MTALIIKWNIKANFKFFCILIYALKIKDQISWLLFSSISEFLRNIVKKLRYEFLKNPTRLGLCYEHDF
ncbi:hypothetical protein BpHYR1_015799 [Brachionus plicatilis]|uniref:Uncharacterized protein n=1 Tax=Brachionus plicatilis TaxID=10195 RepID=A0A3M7T3K0_BRAPC|nr:hypothetical protein BpHYR1_015799 [Brachionus plicatilis]